MKKIFQKKTLIIFLCFLFLLSVIPAAILAVGGLQYYEIPAVTSDSITTQRGATTIVNRSDKKYFVPNKTTPEWDAFKDNAPKYVSVSTCGDGVCGDIETTNNCPSDCPTTSGYCGDGVCGTASSTLVEVHYVTPKPVNEYEKICVQKVKGWMWVPAVNIILFVSGNATYTECKDVLKTVYVYTGWELGNETWEDVLPNSKTVTCKDDCAAPAGSGCSVCGYDDNNNLCPNFCNDRGYNMVNCVYKNAEQIFIKLGTVASLDKPAIKKYLTAADALAIGVEAARYSGEDETSYTIEGRYVCDYGSDTTNLCPRGNYCPRTGGLKPGTSLTAWATTYGYSLADLQKTCEPGFFCPTGASYPRPCPINTYSNAGAAACTACPAGTKSVGNSAGVDKCLPVSKTGDKVCNIANGVNSENPINSSYDCPDASQVGTLWKGDGRCTGAETMTNSPDDCSCGNGVCDSSETYLSCMNDCYCMDNICGSRLFVKSVPTVFQEGKTCNYYGTLIPNKSDCKYMNAGEVCGNGTCESGEGFNSSLGKIVCALDCHCGDNSCNYSEFYSSTGAAGSCNLDCKCGDGTCNNGETHYTCIKDCHCGNYICDNSSPYYENTTNCYNDCKCGDHICSSGETSSSCPSDCNTTCDRDGRCESGEYSSCLDCAKTITPQW